MFISFLYEIFDCLFELPDAVEILLSRYSPKNMNVIEQSVEDIVTQMLIKGKND